MTFIFETKRMILWLFTNQTGVYCQEKSIMKKILTALKWW